MGCCGSPQESWLAPEAWPDGVWLSRRRRGTGHLAMARPSGGSPAFPQECLGLATPRWVQVLVQDLPQQQLERLLVGLDLGTLGARRAGAGGHTAVFQTQSSKLRLTREEPGHVRNCRAPGPAEAVAEGKRAVGSCCWLRAT